MRAAIDHCIRRHTCAALALCAAALAGCPTSPVADGFAALAPGCARDLDCPSGFLCVNADCRIDAQPCDTDGDCLADDVCAGGGCATKCSITGCPDGQSCDPGANVCVTPQLPDAGPSNTCGQDSDCSDGNLCQLGACGPPCAQDADCGDGNVCSQQHCAPAPTCRVNADCSGGYACVQGQCACTADGWSSFAQPLFGTQCTRCHGWANSYPAVFKKQRDIKDTLLGGAAPHDALKGPDRSRLFVWLTCGAPQ